MHEFSGLTGFLTILITVTIVAVLLWVNVGDAITGQGCETIDLCRNITDWLPEWLK